MIETGKHAGQFYVDFSPLGDLTGNPGYQVMYLPFSGYEEARQFELEWLLRNWVLARD